MQEFLDSEECCHNFINQDLTFLQPSTVYKTTASNNSQSTASDSTDASIITFIEDNPSQKVASTSSFTSVTALSDDLVNTDYSHIPIQLVEPASTQPVEPVSGLTTEEQRQREEDPNLTINELLGLSSCEEHVNMPLQTLDGQYVNQPSCFLPLAQEARKLSQKIKQKEEASQWSGTPVEQLLNSSFMEQLNSIQSLQQIAPLYAVKEHLPKDIITILERLDKVDNMLFNKLYYLVENCVDHYYTSVIKTFIEIIKCSVTDHQIVLVNTARALKYLEDFGQRQSQLFKVLEKYHLLPDNFENLQSQFGFLKQVTLKNIEHLQQAINVQQTCAATIYTYINSILPCITKLEQTVLELQQKITMDQDRVQINAPDYDPDIDGPNPPRRHTNTVVVSVHEHFTPSESAILDATESQAGDDTADESSDFVYHNSEESHGYEDFPSDIQNNTTEQNQITPEYSAYSEEIPELEEDWDNGQFVDAESTLITHHNAHSESE